MIGLLTARAVVIDENEQEAAPLLAALGKTGVGAVYFRGDNPADLPAVPLRGIRVVFLDLQLGSQTEPKQFLPETVAVLKKSVAVDGATTGIVCWTKQDGEIAGELTRQLATAGITPAFLVWIDDKNKYLDPGTIGELVAEIQSKHAASASRSMIMKWEQDVHDCASALSARLLENTSKDGEDRAIKRLAAIAQAAAEERIETPASSAFALSCGLTPLHLDEMESMPPASDAAASKLFEAVKKIRKDRLSCDERGELNAALIYTDCRTGSSPRPGNIYVENGWKNGDFPGKLDQTAIKSFVDELFPGKDPEFIAAVNAEAIPCMVEITPACDAASKPKFNPRLLQGLLIKSPGDEERESYRQLPMQSRMHARDVEFVAIKLPDRSVEGRYKLIVSARRLSHIPYDALTDSQPLICLRHSVLTDIRAWFASHAARPGYLAVH